MENKERLFINNHLSSYYKKADFRIPEVERREFGIGNVKKIDARHLAFKNIEELRAYLSNNPPLFVSHSAAYYELPAATPINRKNWFGADLIFDLDLHAEGKYGVYKILDSAKNDVIRLVEDFIFSDFGIDKKDVAIVFSGNRGYHVHVRSKDYLTLGPEERREIVDYIKGTGLNYKNFFSQEEIRKGVIKLNGPKSSDAGFRGRFAKQTLSILNSSPQSISKKLILEKSSFIKGIEEGNWSRTSVPNLIEKLSIVAEKLPLSTIDADAGVTYDVSKLIRVPNSIHGETALAAKIVDNINDFNPLSDAIAFEKGEVTIELLEDVPSLNFGGIKTEELKKETKKEVALSLGLFLVLKGSAKITF